MTNSLKKDFTHLPMVRLAKLIKPGGEINLASYWGSLL